MPFGVVHGRLDRATRDDTMAAFRDGTLRVLVATTVIEVGVDVPNASLMVILGPTALDWPNCTNCGAGSAAERPPPPASWSPILPPKTAKPGSMPWWAPPTGS